MERAPLPFTPMSSTTSSELQTSGLISDQLESMVGDRHTHPGRAPAEPVAGSTGVLRPTVTSLTSPPIIEVLCPSDDSSNDSDFEVDTEEGSETDSSDDAMESDNEDGV